MRTNKKVVTPPVFTHGGSVASNLNVEQQLRRSVLANMLFEDIAYEDGKSIADRIKELVPLVKPEKVVALAIEARSKMNLRHVPLLLAYQMTTVDSHKGYVGDLLPRIIQRPDEITEFLAIYKKFSAGKTKANGTKGIKLAAQVKKGLAKAFTKFDEYQLAKYNGPAEFKLRDVMFLAHAKPKDGRKGYTKDVRAALRDGSAKLPGLKLRPGEVLLQKLTENTLETPDTWEVNLSAGADKKETFERLMADGKLGVMAFLRNLRNMEQAGVPKKTIKAYSQTVAVERALPFRFVSAARAVPGWEDVLDPMMIRCLEKQEKLPGTTLLIVDVSGSMMSSLSGKSDLSRLDAAGALAALAKELCEESYIFATAGCDSTRIHQTALVPSRKGFALVDAITNDAYGKLGGGGIFLIQSMDYVKADLKKRKIDPASVDRVIVFTDEQDTSGKDPKKADVFAKNNYMVNVSSEKNGIGYGKWTNISGFSEAVFDFIRAVEKPEN